MTHIVPSVVDPHTTARLLQDQVRITMIDVRTPAEFQAAHIPGSYNVPLHQIQEHRNTLRDALRTPVVLVCRSGLRARQAENVLQEADITHLSVLEGGINAWESAAQPLNRGRQRWSMERQVRGVAGTIVVLGTLGSMFVWTPFRILSALVGVGLTFSALTDTCTMATLLSKLPYNQAVTCDVRDTISQIANDAA